MDAIFLALAKLEARNFKKSVNEATAPRKPYLDALASQCLEALK